MPLPGQLLTLFAHPGLPYAVREEGRSWVLVLGEPVRVEEGLVGASAVAARLATMLETAPLQEVKTAAASLAGSWLVAVSTPGRSVVLTDPLASLGAHLTPDGRGVVSHATLAGAPWRRPGACGCPPRVPPPRMRCSRSATFSTRSCRGRV